MAPPRLDAEDDRRSRRRAHRANTPLVVRPARSPPGPPDRRTPPPTELAGAPVRSPAPPTHVLVEQHAEKPVRAGPGQAARRRRPGRSAWARGQRVPRSARSASTAPGSSGPDVLVDVEGVVGVVLRLDLG